MIACNHSKTNGVFGVAWPNSWDHQLSAGAADENGGIGS
jgi:hypothetical protein